MILSKKGSPFFRGANFLLRGVLHICLAQFFGGDGCRGEGAQKQTQGRPVRCWCRPSVQRLVETERGW